MTHDPLQLTHLAVGQNPVPGEHQHKWQMDLHPPENGALGYANHGHVGYPSSN